MKILAIADKESKNYWDFYEPGKLDDIDLIISCGDLNPHYLSFLVTFAHCPVLYVHGNHDDKYVQVPPEGCISIEDDIYVHNGVRILGLGGCLRYNAGVFQYEQVEMEKRVRKMFLKLKWHKGFDILVTHAPALFVGDGDDRCHKGFGIFRELLEKYKPKYFLHGHVHMSYGRKFSRHNVFGDTLIINPYETYIFEYETEYDKELEKQRKKKLQLEQEEAEKKAKRGEPEQEETAPVKKSFFKKNDKPYKSDSSYKVMSKKWRK